MKMNTPGLVVICVLAQLAAANYNWDIAKSYPNPSNTNNECTPEQESGFDWSDLPAGGFDSYKGFDFSGFDCSESDSKRSLGKYIQGKVYKTAEAAPRISRPGNEGFSITDMQVSTSYDTDIDFVYDMPDGSSCTQTETCSKEGSNVRNTQCGGAVSVSLQLPQHASDEDCDVGVYSVGFDCQPASTPSAPSATTETISSATTPSEATSPAVASSEVATESSSAVTDIESYSSTESESTVSSISASTNDETKPTSSAPTSSAPSSAESLSSAESITPISGAENTASPSPSDFTSSAPSSESSPPTKHSSSVETSTGSPITPIDVSVPMTTSTIWSTFTSTTYACSSDIPDCPASALKIITMTTSVGTTVCPVTSEESSGPYTSIPTLDTSTSTPEIAVSTTATPISFPVPSAPAPETPASSLEPSASVPQTSQPETKTETLPAPSTPTSVLPGSTVAQPSSIPGSSLPLESSASDSTSPASSAVTVETSTAIPAGSGILTNELVYTTTTSFPITITSTSGSSTIITTAITMTETVVTSTITVCRQCTEAPPTTLTSARLTTSLAPTPGVTESTSPAAATSILPGSDSSSVPVPSNAPCPEVLPSCLNTWLSLVPSCSSNSDASCYCPSEEFTLAVIGCVQAWGASAEEMSAALSYFTGICAASVPQNPAIITAVPSTITLCPTPSDSVAAVAATSMRATGSSETVTQSDAVTSMVASIQSAPIPVPVTIISYTQTVAPVAGGSSVMTSAVTVPQVSFITNGAIPATPAAGQSGAASDAITSVGLVPALNPVTTPTKPPSGGLYNGTMATATSGGVVQFTGAAVRIDANAVGAGLAAFAGAVALLF